MTDTTHKRRSIDDLDITDDFIFSVVFDRNPDLCKEFLEMLLHKKILQIVKVVPQYSVNIRDDAHAVRYDVYVEEPDGAVYDIEMQVIFCDDLPKRSRYYHAMLAMDQLKTGEHYGELRESYVIFICRDTGKSGFILPYYHFEMRAGDLDRSLLEDEELKSAISKFLAESRVAASSSEDSPETSGENLSKTSGQNPDDMVNKILSAVAERAHVTHLNDGMHTILLNASGNLDLVSGELRKFLQYVRDSKNLPVDDSESFVSRLDHAVEKCKRQEDVRSDVMTLSMKLEEWKEAGRKEGREEGREEGRRSGRNSALSDASILFSWLNSENRLDEYQEALKSPDVSEKLLQEFSMKSSPN